MGIHWIATTHGTWLHGDVRGAWRGGRLIGADPFLEAAVRRRMRRHAVVLTAAERVHLAAALGEVVRERGHRVYAATVQSTHMHVVFGLLKEDVKAVIARLKRHSAEALLAARRRSGEDREHLWTQGQFPVFVFTQEHLFNAIEIEYVRRHNVREGRPADPYEWIEALEGRGGVWPRGRGVASSDPASSDPARMAGLYSRAILAR